MTIKTIPQASSISLENRNRDMQKRPVRKNLFGTTVDREELQQQIAQLESESNLTLKNFAIESVIGVIDSASDDKTRKLKRLPSCLDETDDDDEDDEEPQRVDASSEISTDSDSDSQDKAKTDDVPSASFTQPPTTSKKPEVRFVKQLKTKGQKLVTGKIAGTLLNESTNLKFPF